MTLKDQFNKLKDHWLVIAVIVVLVLVLNNFNGVNFGTSSFDNPIEKAFGSAASERIFFDDGDFAPEAEERVLTKNAHTSIGFKRGTFDNINNKLKEEVEIHKGIIINKNVNNYQNNNQERVSAYYTVKIPENEYETFIADIKKLGNVESFRENVNDITANYLRIEDQIELEKSRLQKYENLFTSSNNVEEKILLTDRIFNQERTIKNLENSLNNQDLRVEYVSVSIQLNEEESNFAGTALVTVKEIIASFIDSLNSVIKLLFWAIPWLVVIWMIRIIYLMVKKE